MRKRSLQMVVAVIAFGLIAMACGSEKSRVSGEATGATDTPSADLVQAVDLRSGLTGLLTEHVYLAALATGSALRGDEAGFNAYATALNGESDSNTSELVDAVGSIYGDEVKTAFDGLWRSEGHIPAFVAYTQAAAKDDNAGKQKALQDLQGYAKTFGETMNSVNENLPADAVTAGITHHAETLIAVIDAQKAKNPAGTYAALRLAYKHMSDLAKTLTAATAQKFPDKIEGDGNSQAAGLQATLTSLLREHVFLASSATAGALRGDMAAFNAAAGALNGPTNSNTSSLVGAIGSVYGGEVQKAFDGLWRSEGHIPGFVAYTQAVAKDDDAAKAKALESLTAYATTFGETMNSVNENLPADVVTDAITMHATTLIAVIDAQKAEDRNTEATALREAVHHMSGTAKALAGGTVAKFPEKFGG